MPTAARQNALFMSEQWERAYEALTQVDFRAYDQDTLRRAIFDYIRTTYPEEYDDWIGSSEFLIRVDVLAWLSQNISWRVDLNSRENFMPTADRRDSILRLAENILYSASRVRGARGEVKITSLRTTQQLTDADGQTIEKVKWNDAADPDWLEKWNVVLNSALSARNPIGRPIKRHSDQLTGNVALYRLNSLAPANGVYSFSSNVAGSSLPFELINADLNPLTGNLEEISPNSGNPYHFVHRTDGRGNGSPGTGFFIPIRQGTIGHYDVDLSVPQAGQIVNVPSSNIDQDDVWVIRVGSDGRSIEEWVRADLADGLSVGFYPQEERALFEVLTRSNDTISIRFGDGKFGKIPEGKFRIWYRSVSPNARAVRASDIKDRQITIPYVSGGRVYNLTVWVELSGDLTNAALSETDSDIKYRASKVFYSQNRMVTGEDYSSYVLRDNSIIKARSANRTYSGHGLTARLSDPTGTHSSVRLIADDGRIYRQFTTEQTTFSADPLQVPPTDVSDVYIATALANPDQKTLYFNDYPEQNLPAGTWFKVDSTVSERSRGRFMRDPVEPYATALGMDADSDDPLRAAGADTLVRFSGYRGPVVRIDYVVANGTPENGVLMKGLVKDGSPVYSVMTAFRSVLTDSERASVLEQVTLRRTFGLRFLSDGSWRVVQAEDLSTADFSLKNQGDTTGTGKDASWMVKLEYRPIPGSDDQWIMTRRGLSIRFESDRDVRFHHASGELAVDSETGRSLRDRIRMLRTNEERDSLPRLGLEPAFGVDPNSGAVVLVGDGIRTEFDLLSEMTDDRAVFCIDENGAVLSRADFEILHVPGRDRIRFATPITANKRIIVRHDPRARYLSIAAREELGNDVKREYDLGTRDLVTDNAWVFVNGLHKRPAEDYTAFQGYTSSDIIRLTAVPGTGVEVHIKAFHGSGPAFAVLSYVGNGSQVTYSTRSRTDKIWVFVAGKLRNDYTISTADPDNYTITLSAPPVNNAKIEIRTLLFPELSTVKRMTVTSTLNQDSLNIDSLGVLDSSASNLLVWVDGEMKLWSFEGVVLFDSPLAAGKRIDVTFFETVGSMGSGLSQVVAGSYPTQPSFLGRDRTLWVTGNILHSDGYTNPNGVLVTDEDADSGGDADDPFLFREFVLQDGQDMVIWRKQLQQGADVWDPISESTVPKATVESARTHVTLGSPVLAPRGPNDVHRTAAGTYLVADPTTMLWVLAPDQSAYRSEIGRSGIQFIWDHHSPIGSAIGPSPTNIIDIFVLTSGYDSAVRSWARANQPVAQFPAAERTDVLKNSYLKHEDVKMISDAVVWRPAKYKPLFGPRSAEELRTKILVVRTPGIGINDQDLRLKVLTAIDDYFDPRLWDFGETFYFTELAAYMHRRLPTLVRSIVPVPRYGIGTFGRVFQVRAEPDEMFVSCAVPEDVEIVDSLTESEMKV